MTPVSPSQDPTAETERSSTFKWQNSLINSILLRSKDSFWVSEYLRCLFLRSKVRWFCAFASRGWSFTTSPSERLPISHNVWVTHHGCSTSILWKNLSRCGQVDTSSCHIPPQVFVLWGINVTGLCWYYVVCLVCVWCEFWCGSQQNFALARDVQGFSLQQSVVLMWWLISDPLLFQHGSALVRKVTSRKKLFSKFGVEELDWPAQSPDLNPVPHLWDGLECWLWARPYHPPSVPDLTHALEVKWEQTPAARFLNVFFDFMCGVHLLCLIGHTLKGILWI